MMQAFVDETGSDERSRVFVFSALIGEAQRMARLSDEWNAVLCQSPSIRYFKMDEAESCNGQFYGFSGLERDAKLKSLCRLLTSGGLTEFSFRTNMDIFEQTLAKAERPMCEPYFFPFHATIAGVGYEVLALGQKEPLEIFFDENVIFGPRAKAWYPVVRAMQEDILQPVLPVEPFFRDDERVLPLQAADLTAWIHRKSNDGSLGEFAWLLNELSGLVQSPLSRSLDEQLAHSIMNPGEFRGSKLDTWQAIMRAYQETFGHEWPPKTTLDWKAVRGRAKRK